MKILTFVLYILSVFLFPLSVSSQQSSVQDSVIKLIVRGDDLGFCRAANVACIESYKKGILRSVEVMVPCPWFMDAVYMLKDNPGLDVGVHLTVTSEWKNFKWSPITEAKGLRDSNGYFFSSIQDLQESNAKPEIVEKELRAQIELAIKFIPNLTHITSHMGALSCRPEYIQIVEKLSKEYALPLNVKDDCKRLGIWDTKAKEKEDVLANMIKEMTPGLWIIVCHPGLDTPETQGITTSDMHPANEFMAEYREAVTKALTSERIRALIKKRGIQLVSYGDVIK